MFFRVLRVVENPVTSALWSTLDSWYRSDLYKSRWYNSGGADFLRFFWEQNDPRLRYRRGTLAPWRAFKSHVNRVCKSAKLFIAFRPAGTKLHGNIFIWLSSECSQNERMLPMYCWWTSSQQLSWIISRHHLNISAESIKKMDLSSM